jgi:hypothetical protein
MKRPLTGLVVTYAAGIWLGSLVNVSWPVVVAALVIFLCVCRSRYSLIALLAAILCAGMFAYRYSTTSRTPNHVANLVERRDQNIALRGTIVSDPGYRDAEGADAEPTGDRHSFKLDLEAINNRGEWVAAAGRVLVFVSLTREQKPLRYGDQIECTAILRVPPPARNPGTFDWARWLTLQNIPFTATIRKSDTCRVLGVEAGNPWIALSLRLRERFERALRVGLERDPDIAGVLTGMIIGERSEIPPETYADFQRTGDQRAACRAGNRDYFAAVARGAGAAPVVRGAGNSAADVVRVRDRRASGRGAGVGDGVRVVDQLDAGAAGGWIQQSCSRGVGDFVVAAGAVVRWRIHPVVQRGARVVDNRAANSEPPQEVRRPGRVHSRPTLAALAFVGGTAGSLVRPTAELLAGRVDRAGAVDGGVFSLVHADQRSGKRAGGADAWVHHRAGNGERGGARRLAVADNDV